MIQKSPGMVLGSGDIERPVDFVSHVNWSELLIGPCLAEYSYNSDTRGVQLSLRWLTVDLTFKDVSLISPELLARLFSTASPDPSNGGS